ncbi:MAG: hypothetical protein IPF92_17615 [Myxococcales bacterium]|nr:hypothetical protein [Myxococcales bacterium]MBL0196070.1 hypothetical protein [Myxococcales bacterium]HQY62409.1 hypothetical protein [Polyangiaceae bacterium]
MPRALPPTGLALAFLAPALFALAGGCASDVSPPASALAPLDVPAGCDPLLGGAVCYLPFPSDHARKPDPSSPTGARIVVPEGAKLVATSGRSGDVHPALRLDGFSTLTPIVATLPGALSSRGLPAIDSDGALSATVASPTLLVDAGTGELVAHYADVNGQPGDEAEGGTKRPLSLRPFAKLKPRTRYVVALRGVLTDSGDRAAPAEGFRRLRDKTADEPGLAPLRERFERDVFAPLEKLGLPRAELQLAWDFTTGSDDAPLVDMLRVRELTLAWLKENAPKVAVTRVEPRSGPTWRVVFGTIEAPAFVLADSPGARLARDPSGAVVARGTTKVPFSVHVPASLKGRCVPGRSIAYGHGFFGTQEEMTSAPATSTSNALSAVTFGVDWIGLSKPDLGWLANTLSAEPSRVGELTDRLHQAMANWMVVTDAARRAGFSAPELRRPDAGEGSCVAEGQAGALLYDPTRVDYYGPSLGAILGGVLSTLDPNITRAALNVPGAGLAHMMPRSEAFAPLFALVHLVFGDPLRDHAFAASMQGALDSVDPASYASRMLSQRLPGSPGDRRVLLQVGLGDAAVPALGAFLYARALGIAQTSPEPVSVFGVKAAPPESLTSGMTLFDYGLGANNALPRPVPSNAVHDDLRKRPEATSQLDKFFTAQGAITHPCAGPCRFTLK